MSKFFSSKYASLVPYVPGEQPKEREYIKLNTNESPFTPSPLAISYAQQEVSKCYLYSDPDSKELTSTVAEYEGVKAQQVLMTNGSDEILNFAFMAYCDKDTPAVFPDITYGFYKVFAEINNVPYRKIPLGEDFTINKEDYYDAKGTIFIANPNAPTGINLSLKDIEDILIHNLDNVVVVDEAYVDFGGNSAVSLIEKYDNLLVTKTFSKSRSLAGARLGYGISNVKMITDLNSIKYSLNPYNVNRMTARAGIGSIKDDGYFKKNIQSIKEAREYTEQQLKQLGFSLTDSKANFIFVKSDKISGKELYEKLKQKGILVRHFNLERICEYNRVTIGSISQMQKFIECVKEILEEVQ